MKTKLFKLLFVFLCALGVLFIVGCGEQGNEEDEDKATIEFNEDYSQIAVKEEILIEYTVMNGSEASAEFETSDETILTVDELGYMMGKKEGEAEITIKVNLVDGSVLEKKISVVVGDHTEYKVQFQLAGGKCDVEVGIVKKGGTYVLPIPTKEKAEFLGWSMSGVKGYITEVTNVTSNVTVRANWLSYYTVKYEVNGGTYDKTQEEVKEGTPIELGTPTKAGNKFLGWSLSKTSTSYVTKLGNVNSNCTIYAQWEPTKIDITFDLDGGYYNGPKYVVYDGTLELTRAQKAGNKFLGWSLEKGSTNYVTKLTNVIAPTKLYANYQASSEIDCIVTNLPEDGIAYGKNLQLAWEFTSGTGTLSFTSSDTSILKVSDKGLINAIKPGVATITLKVKEYANLTQTIEVIVYKPGAFEAAYVTNSYAAVGETIALSTKYVDKYGTPTEVKYKSLDGAIATVDDKGNVKGVSEGNAKIRAYLENKESVYFDYLVTIVSKDASDALKFVLESHESNIFTRYNLPIGAGSPAYNKDIFGSVSKILYDQELQINKTYYDKLGEGVKNNGVMNGVEFITVHYTGNMNKGADADNNVDYFNNLEYRASIHFVTGRSDKFGNNGYSSYQAFAGISEKYAAWHAGEGQAFSWYATGVMAKDTDPQWPTWGISERGKFTINGVETKNSVPVGTTEATKSVTGNTFTYNGSQQPCINEMGLAFKIVNGEYYIGTTYWCYSQIGAGRICSRGGNLHSIGIESCVDEGSDLWHTWQVTAQLVASLMVKYNLDITRVVGHHFFTAKDCPQPMLENDKEIWWKFIELVEAEYAKITKFKDYTFEFKQVSGSGAEGVRTEQSPDTKLITYKVTIKKGTQTQEVTLGSVMAGSYLR